MTSSDFSTALDDLKSQFVRRLQERMDVINATFNAIHPESWRSEPAHELHRKIHGLSGASGTFGLQAITRYSQTLENRLAHWLETAQPPSPTEWEEARQLLERINQLAKESNGSGDFRSLKVPPLCPPPSRTPLVHLLAPDPQQAQPLLELVSTQGYRVRWIEQEDTLYARPAEGDESPAALLLDLDACTDPQRLLVWLRGLHQPSACPCPVIVLSQHHGLKERLQAFRAGATRYLKKPVDPDTLIEVLDVFTKRLPQDPYRVLMVDDDPLLLEVHADVLRDAGMEIRALSNPLKVLEEMETFSPDVVLLDVYMPQATGPEIAAILRETDSQLPILFVSSESDSSRQLEALGHGGDDFLVKPIHPSHLVTRVVQKARRIRMLRTERSWLLSTLYERHREHVALDHHAIVSITDAQGRITYVNDKFCRISGYSHEELIGQNHRILKSAEHPPVFYETLWNTITQGKVWQGEVCNRRRNGELYWVEATVTPFLDANGLPYQYVSIRTDITAIKQNERRLLAQQTVQQLVNETAARLMNAEGSAIDGVIAEVAQHTAEILGADRARLFLRQDADGSLVQAHVWQLEPSDSDSDIAALSEREIPWWRQMMEGKGCIAQQNVAALPPQALLELDDFGERDALSICVMPFKQGGTLIGFMSFSAAHRHCEHSDHELEWLTLLADVVGGALIRQRTERAIITIKERMRLGQLYANIGTWEWNILTDELFWSECVAPMFGHTEGELETTYRNFLRAVHPDDRQGVSDALHACVTADIPYDIRHRVVWPDGTVRWLHERGAVLRDTHGLPLEMFGVVQDVTTQIEAEQALIVAKDIAQEANRAKSQFLSSMSHELRTPLNAIMGFGQLIQQDTDLPETHQDDAREILKAGEHLLHLINDVLDLAKLEAGRVTIAIESFELDLLIDECLDLVRPMAQRRGIEMQLIGIGECHVSADRTRVKQVLLNLLSNAIKYNVTRGSVTLKVEPVDGERLRVWVRDTGPGIAPDKIKDLFQPFNRLGAETSGIEGTGIGLAITRRILQQMQGEIGVDSIQGTGSAFWFELPQGEKPEEEAAPSSSNATIQPEGHTSATNERTCLILYVDDSPSNLRLVTRMLEPHDRYRLVTADHPVYGLELALQHRPDLILLDLSMPEMDGFQVLQVLRSSRELRHAPVIAVTANAMPNDIERGIAAGFDAYLTKPVKIDELMTTMDKLLKV